MRGMSNVRSISIVGALLMTFLLTACTPTVMLDTSEPITINLNVNIKHEILVRVDKQLDDLFSDDSDIF
jgi:hypothetical protein